jgi:ATP-dependent protease HslVU (ClpYQ) peptidase subunit
MSTVIAIVDDGKIWMGADSYATTSDGERRRIICKKIFINGPYLIGFVGSVRTGQVIQPKYFEAPEDVFEFPDMLLEQLANKGCLGTNSEDQSYFQSSNFLIGTSKGRLYELLTDFQMSEIEDYTSVGSGSPYALGSLYTTRRWKNQEKRIMVALKAAAVYDTCSGPPYVIEEF